MDLSINSFEDFKNECIEQTTPLQEAFIKLYHINSYEHWFYDHGIGAFHFRSDDGRNLYFKYVDVGSYSTKTNSWLWSWDNNSVPKRVTIGIEKVRAFGEAKGFSELSQSYITEADEYTGWALASITAKLLSAIGLYRIPQDHLFSFFVFTNELTQEEYDFLKEKRIDCDRHGSSRMAFVCQHLLSGKGLGFHETFDSDPLVEAKEDCQAWCDECEKAWEKEREWNETFTAIVKLKLVCEQCYFDIKSRSKTDDDVH
jgi:hypothetical protein